jgi:DNA-binding NtrC family response regulator
MAANSPRVLLIAENPLRVSFLAERLNKWACEGQFAQSCEAATALIINKRFDVVLSQFRLRDGSSYPLAAALIRSNTTVVYSYRVETGRCWLRAVKSRENLVHELASIQHE